MSGGCRGSRRVGAWLSERVSATRLQGCCVAFLTSVCVCVCVCVCVYLPGLIEEGDTVIRNQILV